MASVPVIPEPLAVKSFEKLLTSTSNGGTEDKPIAVQKKCQNSELASGDHSA